MKKLLVLLSFFAAAYIALHYWANTPDVKKETPAPPYVPKFENLKISGKVTKSAVVGISSRMSDVARVQHAIRFRSILYRIGSKYSIDPNLMLAMIIQESGGEILLNGTDDGGAGICHMQPYNAARLGLKTLGNCKKMVDHEHGRALRQLWIEHKGDLAALSKFDDRFDPVKNMDAVARMLREKNSSSKLPFEQAAILHYAGKKNFPHYWRELERYRSLLNDSSFMQEVGQEFNISNGTAFKIDGKPGDWQGYLVAHDRYFKEVWLQ
jgi:hypothetical protein